MKEATESVQQGISVGRATVSLIRYADDKAVVASSQRRLQCFTDSLNRLSREDRGGRTIHEVGKEYIC